MSQPRSYIGSAVVPFRLVFLMWLVFTLDFYYGLGLWRFGLIPRNLFGLIGIFTAPMIHGNLIHLISNTIPLLFLGGTLFFFYNRIGKRVFFSCYFIPSIIVWFLDGSGTVHIGASGLIYGVAAFLISFGILRRDMMSILISIVVILLYGGIFYGVLPTDPRVSWQMHLAGTIVGVVMAFVFRNTKKI